MIISLYIQTHILELWSPKTFSLSNCLLCCSIYPWTCDCCLILMNNCGYKAGWVGIVIHPTFYIIINFKSAWDSTCTNDYFHLYLFFFFAIFHRPNFFNVVALFYSGCFATFKYCLNLKINDVIHLLFTAATS